MKKCPMCEKDLPHAAFYSHPFTKDKLSHQCKECRKAYMREHRKAHVEEYKERDRIRYQRDKEKKRVVRLQYYYKNRDLLLAKAKVWHRINKHKVQDYKLRNKYGITKDQFDAILVQQEGRCAICKEEIQGKKCLDHDHITNTPRGILCNTCNRVIGMFCDNACRLRNAADYVEFFRSGAVNA